MKNVATILLLAACGSQSPNTGTVASQLVGSAPEWARHTITLATTAAGSPLRGADGVALKDIDGDGLLDVVTPWEQGDAVSVAFHPQGAPCTWSAEWTTTIVGTNVGAEDAIFADIDADGRIDVVSASEASKQIKVHFNDQAGWTTVVVNSGLQKWMQLAWDGTYLYAGGKTSPATVGYFSFTSARVAGSWSYTAIGPVGWTMTLDVFDVDGDQDNDVVLSDRAYITQPAVDKTLWGSRWLEQTSSGWISHTIGLRTTSEPKFMTIHDWDADGDLDVVDGASKTNSTNFLTVRLNGGDFKTWTTALTLSMPSGVGLYHDVAVADVDQDNSLDLVVSYSEASGNLTGVAWFKDNGSGTWLPNEISGADGTKFDNIEMVDVDADGDLDVLTSEQYDGLGVVWYENPVL